MKTISLITAALLIALVILAATMDLSGEYDRGYLDGYRQKQIENLPAPGVERVKRPDAGLIVKGGRG